MTTRNIVPRATGEGSIGTSAKKWNAVYTENLSVTNEIQGTVKNATNDKNGNDIAETYLPLIGGTVTGITYFDERTKFKTSIDLLEGDVEHGRLYNISNTLRIAGGTSTADGSWIDLSYTGGGTQQFRIFANDGTTQKALVGKPDGTLTWNDIPFGLGNGTYDLTFYSYGYITAGGTSLELTFPYIAKNKNIRFNSLTGTLRSYKGYLSPGGSGGGDILTGSTQGTWYNKNFSYPCVFRLVRSDGWGANGENNTVVVSVLTANVTVTDA